MRPLRRAGPPGAPRRPGRLRLWLRRLRQWRQPLLLGGGAVLLLVLAAGTLTSGAALRLGESVRHGAAAWLAAAGLRLDRIELEGRVHTDNAALLAAVGARRGDAMLEIDAAAVRARLKALAWVRDAEVRRRLPSTLEVTLSERTPFAFWQHQGRHVVIDRDGVVLAAANLESFGALPLVVGAGAATRAAAILDLIARTPAVNERFVAAVRVADRRWNIRLTTGADVLLPEGAEAPALERLASLQASHGLLDRALAAVDMRLPDRLVLRPLQAAPDRPQQGRAADEPRGRG